MAKDNGDNGGGQIVVFTNMGMATIEKGGAFLALKMGNQSRLKSSMKKGLSECSAPIILLTMLGSFLLQL